LTHNGHRKQIPAADWLNVYHVPFSGAMANLLSDDLDALDNPKNTVNSVISTNGRNPEIAAKDKIPH
jgi:hypothetical protein